MGMTGPVATMIGMLGGGLGGPLLSGMFAPDMQERQSFEGEPGLSPTDFLGRTRDIMGELGSVLSDRASQPVSLPSAFVQQPGAYTGGGLPMPIGVVGSDPALGNPDLLSKPGLPTDKLGAMFREMTEGAGGGTGYTPGAVINPRGV
jgi:hypothetical protein